MHFISVAFIVITAMVVVSCEKQVAKKPVLVTGVQIDKSEITLVLINDTGQLTATVLPEMQRTRRLHGLRVMMLLQRSTAVVW